LDVGAVALRWVGAVGGCVSTTAGVISIVERSQ
jgi:hypothetical protein